MGKVVFDTSMSLDGFMTAAGQTAEEPLGTAASACTSGRSSRKGRTAISWPS